MTSVDTAPSASNADFISRRALERLSAGLSHELNSPIQFIGDNARFLADACQDLLALVRSYEEVLGSADCLEEAGRARLREAEREAELDYLHGEIPGAVQHLLGGIQRVSTVVEALRILSHPGHDGREPADLNEMLDAALTLTRHAINDVAELHLDLGELPPVRCDVAGITEVFLALIVNAIEGIENVGRRGTILISTRQAGCEAVVAIAYDADEVCDGTPQARHALSVVRAIVEEGHGGTLVSDTARHVGSRISIRLPINGR